MKASRASADDRSHDHKLDYVALLRSICADRGGCSLYYPPGELRKEL